MRRVGLMALALLLLTIRSAGAQVAGEPPPAPDDQDPPAGALEAPTVLDVDSTEWMVSGGPAFGVVVFHSAVGHRYVLQTISWGRILSAPRLRGVLRGRFEWAVEAVPIFGQVSPSNTYGFGVSPLVWRWNFEPHGRLAPYAELAGGGLWTRDPVPERTTTSNFMAHLGYGVRYFFRPQQALVVGYRFHHISNGNRLDRNPGVNAHVVQIGLSLVRPSR
ncbi:MAG: acyloxyacyl hydrolase [Acidobacteriota bacterium]